MALKPYLQLVRLPNLFTAAADSLAGWLLVTGSCAHPERWLPLLGASMAIYAAGIALNDYFDREIDRTERPNRPIPSGQVSARFAANLGGGLLVVGLALATLGGLLGGTLMSSLVALALIACVLGYDAGLKRTPLGPLAMGACRGLNLLLGMSQAPGLGGPTGWLVSGALMLFVVGLTCISRSETATGERAGVLLGVILQNLALAGLVAVSWRPGAAWGLGVLAAAAVLINWANWRAWSDPRPVTLQRAVKTGVLALIWLNVGVVASIQRPELGLAVAFLWLPAYILANWLYST